MKIKIEQKWHFIRHPCFPWKVQREEKKIARYPRYNYNNNLNCTYCEMNVWQSVWERTNGEKVQQFTEYNWNDVVMAHTLHFAHFTCISCITIFVQPKLEQSCSFFARLLFARSSNPPKIGVFICFGWYPNIVLNKLTASTTAIIRLLSKLFTLRPFHSTSAYVWSMFCLWFPPPNNRHDFVWPQIAECRKQTHSFIIKYIVIILFRLLKQFTFTWLKFVFFFATLSRYCNHFAPTIQNVWASNLKLSF